APDVAVDRVEELLDAMALGAAACRAGRARAGLSRAGPGVRRERAAQLGGAARHLEQPIEEGVELGELDAHGLECLVCGGGPRRMVGGRAGGGLGRAACTTAAAAAAGAGAAMAG